MFFLRLEKDISNVLFTEMIYEDLSVVRNTKFLLCIFLSGNRPPRNVCIII